MSIKFWVLKFREDLNSWVFNFAIFFKTAKNAKLSTKKVNQGFFGIAN